MVFLSVIAWADVRGCGAALRIYPRQLLDTHFNLMYPDVPTVIAQVIGAAFAMISAMTVVNSCYCCRSLHEARKGIIVVAVLVTIFALLPAAIGLSGRILLPESNGKGILLRNGKPFVARLGRPREHCNTRRGSLYGPRNTAYAGHYCCARYLFEYLSQRRAIKSR